MSGKVTACRFAILKDNSIVETVFPKRARILTVKKISNHEDGSLFEFQIFHYHKHWGEKRRFILLEQNECLNREEIKKMRGLKFLGEFNEIDEARPGVLYFLFEVIVGESLRIE